MNAINILSVLFGCITSTAGVICLHYQSRKNHILIRLLTICAIFFGLGLIWNEMAKKAPVVVNSQLEIFNKEGPILILKGSYDTVRNCRLKDYTSKARFNDNTTIDLEVDYFNVNRDVDKKSETYFFIKNVFSNKEQIPINLDIHAVYMCAFGIEITENFPSINILEVMLKYDF
jgi:hypothetical protein